MSARCWPHAAAGPDLLAARPGQTLIGDKNYYGHDFEAAIAAGGIRLLRPARKGEPARAARPQGGRKKEREKEEEEAEEGEGGEEGERKREEARSIGLAVRP